MATIVKKRIKGHPYYYLVQTAWRDGRSRIVHQRYLGKAEDIARAVTERGSPRAVSARVEAFGAVATLYRKAEQLGVVEIIDRHAPKRQQGPTVGQYLLVAAINRAVAPTSKAKMAQWFAQTALGQWLPFSERQLASQRFWDHMGYLTAERIRAIEDDLTARIAAAEGLDLRALVYDTTNFFTWIDTMSAAELPQRGHSKAKRHDLKQVGLAMLVTTDFHVPLFHEVYPGNRPDAAEFGSVTESLLARYRLLCQHCQDVTLVYDKGNNSRANQAVIDGAPLHFVGSLVPSRHPDLLDVPRREFQPLRGPEFGGVLAYRTEREVMGVKRTVVVTYNESLYLGQLQGILLRLRKVNDALRRLQRTLAERAARGPRARGRALTLSSVQSRLKAILHDRTLPLAAWFRPVVCEEAGRILLNYTLDHEAQQAYFNRHLGKNILFTDRHDWSTEAIVAAYRGQAAIESAFKEMKDPRFLCWQPMFHWTDDKIRVHAFYCVLALTLVALVRRSLAQQGVELSAAELLSALNGINRVLHLYPEGSRIKPHWTLSERDDVQERLVAALDLLPLVES
ncbi:MAG: IS1634 family transposase [Acetobacteraceae bacterium]|nr:IS1634 family transposase [Acetobacteraceae bacterium]